MKMKVPKAITSEQNSTVQHLSKIRADKKYRREVGTSLLFGDLRLLSEVCFSQFSEKIKEEKLKDFITPESLLLHPKIYEKSTLKLPTCKQRFSITDEKIFKKISGLQSINEENFFIMELKTPQQENLINKDSAPLNLVVINGVQDPSNLGVILRNCIAFDYQHIFLLDNTVDVFNDKCIRASRASLFIPNRNNSFSSSFNRLTYEYGDWKSLKQIIEKFSFLPFVTHTFGFSLEDIKPFNHKLRKAIIFNNESQGPLNLNSLPPSSSPSSSSSLPASPFYIVKPSDIEKDKEEYTRKLFDHYMEKNTKCSLGSCLPLTIPFNSSYCSSLNVANAASILLYSFGRAKNN